MIEKLREDLIRDEGLRLKPYKDSVGLLTIGVGRNLEHNGITKDEAEYLLTNDINTVLAELDRNIPWWRDHPEPVRRGMANMAFNLGWPRLSKFKNTLAHIKAGEYDKAATASLDSLWARQVGVRAERIAELFRSA